MRENEIKPPINQKITPFQKTPQIKKLKLLKNTPKIRN